MYYSNYNPATREGYSIAEKAFKHISIHKLKNERLIKAVFSKNLNRLKDEISKYYTAKGLPDVELTEKEVVAIETGYYEYINERQAKLGYDFNNEG